MLEPMELVKFDETEEEYTQTIIEYARLNHWLVYHTWNSRLSEPGFPDLVMIREFAVIAEIKSENGRLSKARWNKKHTRLLPGQDDWQAALISCSGVVYKLWRPSDWEDVVATLGQGRHFI